MRRWRDVARALVRAVSRLVSTLEPPGRGVGMIAGTARMGACATLVVLAGWTQTVAPGKELFERRCSGCHSLDRDKEGPRLGGVYGRVSGSVPSFPYSDALKNAHITWDAESLDKWLAGPDRVVPGNDMAFHVDSATERNEIIAYLKQLR